MDESFAFPGLDDPTVDPYEESRAARDRFFERLTVDWETLQLERSLAASRHPAASDAERMPNTPRVTGDASLG
jgi:hypothetical protein